MARRRRLGLVASAAVCDVRGGVYPGLLHPGLPVRQYESGGRRRRLLALSAPLWRHAQEARAYSLAVLLVILSWLAILKVFEDPSSSAARRWYIGLAAAVVYCHLLGLLFVGAQLLWLASARRRTALIMGVWIGILLVPQFAPALGPQAHQPSWIPPMRVGQLTHALRYLTGTTTSAAAVLAGSIWIACAAIAVRRQHDTRTLALVAWLLLPVFGLMALSVVSPMLMPRYLIMIVPGAVLLVCLAWDAFPRLGLVLLLMLAVLQVPGLTSTLARTGPDWQDATRFFLANAEGDEPVLFVNSRQLIEHYWDQDGRPTPVPVSLTSPTEWGSMRRVDELDMDSAIAVLDGVDGAWVVQRYQSFEPRDRLMITEIERRWPEMSSWSFHGGAILITHYGNRWPCCTRRRAAHENRSTVSSAEGARAARRPGSAPGSDRCGCAEPWRRARVDPRPRPCRRPNRPPGRGRRASQRS